MAFSAEQIRSQMVEGFESEDQARLQEFQASLEAERQAKLDGIDSTVREKLVDQVARLEQSIVDTEQSLSEKIAERDAATAEVAAFDASKVEETVEG